MNTVFHNVLPCLELLVGGEMCYLNHSLKLVFHPRALDISVSTRQHLVPSFHSSSDLPPSFRAAEVGSRSERNEELAHWKTKRISNVLSNAN